MDRYQNVNVLRPYEAYSIAIPNIDPGPDGVVGTADDGGAVTYYDYTAAYAGSAFVQNVDLNTAGYENSYHNIEVAAQKRLSNKWQLVTSVPGHARRQWRNGIPQDPERGELLSRRSKYWEWSFKLSGSYELPVPDPGRRRCSRARAAASGRERPGSRRAWFGCTEVILLMEDPAASRLPTQNILNLRFEKRQKIGPGTAAFQFDLFNVTNTNVELGVTTRSGASFGQITSIVPPRVAKLGVSYTF